MGPLPSSSRDFPRSRSLPGVSETLVRTEMPPAAFRQVAEDDVADAELVVVEPFDAGFLGDDEHVLLRFLIACEVSLRGSV